MKKLILLFLLIALPLIVLMGCTNDAQDDDDGYIDFAPLPADIEEDIPPEQALLGQWAWDEHEGYVYTFYDNGRGRRGDPAHMIMEFFWRVEDGDMLRLNIIDGEIEFWRFTIIDDVLTNYFYGAEGFSEGFQGLSYRYIRLHDESLPVG